MAGTYVYVISGDHGRQKIGVTHDPRRRISELQTGSPFPLRFAFVGQTDGFGYDIEGEVHFTLHQHRQSGEWFTVPPEVAIAAVMGAAYRLGHAMRPVDPERIEAFTPKIKEAWPKWAQWTFFALSMGAFLAVLAKTDHFLTALIVALPVGLIIRSLLRKAIAISG
jgi:Meiotically up-regulated gene 113